MRHDFLTKFEIREVGNSLVVATVHPKVWSGKMSEIAKRMQEAGFELQLSGLQKSRMEMADLMEHMEEEEVLAETPRSDFVMP